MPLEDPVRIKYSISVKGFGVIRESELTISRGTWNSLTSNERVELLDELYETEVSNTLDGDWVIVNADLVDPTVYD